CVRLCKILTDLPLESDRPIDFGLTKFCKACYECAEVCKAQAISSDVEPSFKLACSSNNTGILRWAVNADKCYEFWMENGAACSSCVAVCPFTQQNGSSHSG
ncbi:MAG: 4Fe-4S double cluster binding domain-containing protein, partial [Candidatus Bipolaricaulota bacterium]